MKLLVVGEGSTEYGYGQRLDLANTTEEGVADILIRRLLEAPSSQDLVLDAIPYGGRLPRQPADASYGSDEARRVAVRAREAARRSCDAMVIYHDADRQHESRRAALEQGTAGAPVPTIFAIPIETIEAWLLADPAAFERAFGCRHAQDVRRPENLWGNRRDASSRHPKQVWRRACADVNLDHRLSTSACIAEQLDLAAVEAACPQGFARFASDLRRAIPSFECVVATDRNRGIGKDNQLPWPRLPSDLRHFREVTTTAADGLRNAVIMGRKTWDSLPLRFRPLDGRLNIVVTRQNLQVPNDVIVAHSFDAAILAAGAATDVDRVFIVGGANIYRQALAHFRCAGVYLTRIDAEFDCDATLAEFEPHMRQDPDWQAVHHEENGYAYDIQHWIRAPAE